VRYRRPNGRRVEPIPRPHRFKRRGPAYFNIRTVDHFNHPTQAGNPVSATIYSTSTVDVSAVGMSTIIYWATDPASGDTYGLARTTTVH
jgi:hypothetical protein